MPNKATIIPYLDEITPESKLTGAVNTIVKVRTDSCIRLVGTNTDYLGITVALRTAILSTQAGREYPSSTAHSFPRGQLSGAVIGGGATTRSAILSLHRLGLGPILLINRDEAEVAATTAWFQRTELVREQGLELIHVKDPGEVERYLVDEGSRAPLGIVVGAIPGMRPTVLKLTWLFLCADGL
jgi:shikimate 5-dehydrogenase